jgi:hypothetical protein
MAVSLDGGISLDGSNPMDRSKLLGKCPQMQSDTLHDCRGSAPSFGGSGGGERDRSSLFQLEQSRNLLGHFLGNRGRRLRDRVPLETIL